jgi:hypothetical protein
MSYNDAYNAQWCRRLKCRSTRGLLQHTVENAPTVVVHPVHHNIRIIQGPGIFDPMPLEEKKQLLAESTISNSEQDGHRVISNHERFVRFLNRLNTGVDYLLTTIPFAETSNANLAQMCRFIQELTQLRGNTGCQVAVIITDSWFRTPSLHGQSLEEMAEREGIAQDPCAIPVFFTHALQVLSVHGMSTTPIIMYDLIDLGYLVWLALSS